MALDINLNSSLEELGEIVFDLIIIPPWENGGFGGFSQQFLGLSQQLHRARLQVT